MASPAPVPPPPAHLLVRGVNWLGDAVMTTPALQRLREHLPGARITLLTHEKLADLWTGHPDLDAVLTFRAGESVPSVARRLRREGCDTALLLPNSPRSGLEALLARIPRRVGGAWPWRNGFLTDVVAPDPGAVRMRKRPAAEVHRLAAGATDLPGPDYRRAPHQMHHYLRLAGHLGASTLPAPPRIAVTREEVRIARDQFGLDPARRWLGLNAGAEYGPAKRWPVEHFATVARSVAAWPGWGIALFGGPADVATATGIASALPTGTSIAFPAGRTTLRELAATLAACTALVTNDTGPMHLAAAVGTPVIVPFGSTSPELTGPGLPGDPRHTLVRSTAPCSPCFLRECPIDLRCLRDILPDTVLKPLSRLAQNP